MRVAGFFSVYHYSGINTNTVTSYWDRDDDEQSMTTRRFDRIQIEYIQKQQFE